MKKILHFLFLLCITSAFGQVGISTDTPSPAASLDVNSEISTGVYGGLKLPTVDATQRAAITTPIPDGMLIYFSDTSGRCLQIYNGVADVWADIYCFNEVPRASSAFITGTLQEGNTITATFFYSDLELDSAGAHIYQWYRADDAAGTNEAAIAGATASTYTLTSADAGSFVRFTVIPVATTGSSPGALVSSNYLGPVTAIIPPIAIQDFDSNTAWNFAPGPATYNVSGDVWAQVSALTTIGTLTGDFWGMQDLDNTNGGGGFRHDLIFDAINLTATTNPKLSFDYESSGMNAGSDRYGYELFYDGVSQGEVNICAGCNTATDGTILVNIPGTVNSVIVVLYGQFNGGTDLAAFDNIRIFE